MTRRRRILAFAALTVMTVPVVGCRSESADKGEQAAQAKPAADPAPPAADPAAAPAADPTATAATPAAAGKGRRIDIKVDDKGYHPSSAPAQAGEDLILVFLRTADNECVQEVLVDGKKTELPLNKEVEIPTTMPTSGDLVFTCGMKMYEGRVAVAK
jgi:hypothetical protein